MKSTAFVNALPSALAQTTQPCYSSSKCQFVNRPQVLPQTPRRIQPAPQIEMKKGNRFRQPLQKPSQPNSPALPEDGTPIFSVFVRTQRAQMWYPLGGLQGDGRSKMLVKSLKNRFGRGLYESALDRGVAQTVYGKDKSRFLQSAMRMYPQLKKYRQALEFGYTVSAKDLESRPIKLVSSDLALPFPAWVKKRVSDALKALNKAKDSE